jgi:hypothetical protein
MFLTWLCVGAALAACSAVAPPAAPELRAARLDGALLTVTLSDGRACSLVVPASGPFDLAWPDCPGVTAARGGPARAGQPAILLAPMGERRLEGPVPPGAPPFDVWIWAESGPWLFSR